MGAIDIGVTVADHHRLVARVAVEADFVEAIPDHLILVQARVVFGCAIDAVQQFAQMEMIADRHALVFGLAAGQRQEIPVGPQGEQLFADTGEHDVHESSGNLVAGIVGILEHSAVRVVAAIDIYGAVQILLGHMVALHGLDDRRSNEAAQLSVIRNRTSKFFEGLDDGADNAAVGLGKRAVEIQQDHFHRMLCH